MALTLEIVTPEARVYSDTIDTVVIPTTQGEVGILPGHLPLLTQMQAGELRLSKGGREERLVVGNGFAQVSGDTVSILAENAIDEAKIDETAAEKAIERARQSLKEAESGKLDPVEVDRLEGIVRFMAAQLTVKRRRH